MTTLYQTLSRSLKAIGFKRTTSENQNGAKRSWWSGPRFTLNGLAEILRSDGFELDVYGGKISGEGWSFSPPDSPDIDSDWCLSIFKANKFGHLERMGIDTYDMI